MRRLWRCEGRAIVMTVVMALEEEQGCELYVYMVCKVAEQVEIERFYDGLRSEWDLHSMGELVLDIDDFNGHV